MSAPVWVSDLTRLWNREPAPIEPVPLPCPVWCSNDHSKDLVDSVIDLRQHDVTLATVETGRADHSATIDVSVCDSFLDGTRSAPAVYVWCDDGLTPAAARALAEGLLRAARLVEDWSR